MTLWPCFVPERFVVVVVVVLLLLLLLLLLLFCCCCCCCCCCFLEVQDSTQHLQHGLWALLSPLSNPLSFVLFVVVARPLSSCYFLFSQPSSCPCSIRSLFLADPLIKEALSFYSLGGNQSALATVFFSGFLPPESALMP